MSFPLITPAGFTTFMVISDNRTDEKKIHAFIQFLKDLLFSFLPMVLLHKKGSWRYCAAAVNDVNNIISLKVFLRIQIARPEGRNSVENVGGIQENWTMRIDLLTGGEAVTITRRDRV